MELDSGRWTVKMINEVNDGIIYYKYFLGNIEPFNIVELYIDFKKIIGYILEKYCNDCLILPSMKPFKYIPTRDELLSYKLISFDT